MNLFDNANNHSLARSPLALAVPLEGTEKEIGLKQIQRHLSRRPSIRSQYKRFKGPFFESLTIEDVKRGPKNWQEFLHAAPKDVKMNLTTYSVPGSIESLTERVDENLVHYMVIFNLNIIIVFKKMKNENVDVN